MNHLWISLSTYGGVTTRTALDVLWAAGIRQVELAIGVKPTPDTTAVLQYYQQLGIQYRAHHAIVWQEHRSFNLADSFDATYFERLTDWLAAMQITAYSVHAGRIDTNNSDAHVERFFKHLTQLAQLCRDRSIRLGVETMYPTLHDHAQRYFMQNLAEIEQFFTVMPNVDLVIDLAHLHLWHNCSIPEKLQVLQSANTAFGSAEAVRLLELHISDNDGIRDNHTQISEATWWVPHIAHFPIDIPIVLESRMNGQTVEQVHQQVQRIQSIFTPTISAPTSITMGERHD
ncbi:MAG: TIM barrel protein [Leptolyngbya sp. UWPOB_LEPTO1]|uniref:sugar phosphate isomerase/epimerase family protein n=1 Tax=Leptolyngbya sp. UWPOB_LEPTO1 TaxID=2815653 RepID=UPI001ACFE002|nr:TIM barrel protein [Leptolyngbya sp. UWPOB_LEPTO1]MBN8560116.1 TIM barrel protein [Leptolyngbya sp. UWPOB_LEPTO1]